MKKVSKILFGCNSNDVFAKKLDWFDIENIFFHLSG